MIDLLQAEYGCSLTDAVWRYPLAAALALLPAITERRGGEVTGPDWATRAYIRAYNRAMAFLESHFRIV